MKRLILFRNTHRLRSVFMAQNICTTSDVNNSLNQQSLADGNKFYKSLLNGNEYSFKSLIVVNLSSRTQSFDSSTYERIADHTLEHLYEEFETLVETYAELKDSDVSLNVCIH